MEAILESIKAFAREGVSLADCKAYALDLVKGVKGFDKALLVIRVECVHADVTNPRAKVRRVNRATLINQWAHALPLTPKVKGKIGKLAFANLEDQASHEGWL